MNLRNTLLLDAASAATFIVLCLGLPQALADLTGLPRSIIAIAGWICIPSAALFLWQAVAPTRSLVALIVAGNAGWVIASVGVWFTYFGQLTPLGHAFVIAQAAAVEFFTLMEWRGLRNLGHTPRTA
ncbi:hypothetical protein [Qipengyuania soli]|uniref:Uncharacterized protein n=1 Tax=Qipengyuania soli TaxID=2782568 RepID=A0A7S8F6C9_9SPHN|nr:hypothetical protein [Qipengyuania soli]QPD00015.1 hypothetical protein IRL76_05635 [Qipengyuania soli]